MKKLKVGIVLFLSVVLTASVICWVVTDCIMQIPPKAVISNYKLCQKLDYIIYTEITDPSKTITYTSAKYIGSNNGYDYYIESLYNRFSGEAVEDYFVKKKGKKIVATFDLKELNLANRNDLYEVCGCYRDGCLYFTVESKNSIYRIDDCLNNCSVFFTPQKFGEINVTSFCIVEDIFYYITDLGNLVKYDGVEESKIRKLPEVSSTIEYDDYIHQDFSGYHYYFNNINGVFYYGWDDKLFTVDEDGNAEYLYFKAPKPSCEASQFYRIEPCESNDEIMAVSYYYDAFSVEGKMSGTFRYLINLKNGHRIKCKQSAKNYNRKLSDKDFLDYIDNLRSMASNVEY